MSIVITQRVFWSFVGSQTQCALTVELLASGGYLSISYSFSCSRPELLALGGNLSIGIVIRYKIVSQVGQHCGSKVSMINREDFEVR